MSVTSPPQVAIELHSELPFSPELIKFLTEQAKQKLLDAISASDTPASIILSKLITELIRLVETTELKGADKKKAVIQIGRTVLIECCPEQITTYLPLYDLMVDPLLESMVGFGKMLQQRLLSTDSTTESSCCLPCAWSTKKIEKKE